MWFTEDPWYPILGCILVALALFGMWRTNSRPAYLKGIVAAAIVAAAIYGIERVIVTSSERIDDAVHDMVDAFRRNDPNRTLSHISETATEERSLVTAALGMVDIPDDLRITDMKVTMLDDGRATARFKVNAAIDGSGRRFITRWHLTFQREGNDWKVVRIQRLRFNKDEFIDPMSREL